jgi:hypothetical protein
MARKRNCDILSVKLGVGKNCTLRRKVFQERMKERKKINPKTTKSQTTCNIFKTEGNKHSFD